MILVFEHPERLWLLLAIPILSLWLILGNRRRVREWSALGQSGRPVADGSVWWLASMAPIVLALAQPRWGLAGGPPLPDGHDVVLLVDASRSMAAEDAVPDRLGLAIEAGSSLIRALEAGSGNRVAIVEFAGRGVVRCPLTWNLDAALGVLKSLRAGEIQPGGTDLGGALEVAIGAFDREEHAEGRTIVLLSDGEDHAGSWPSALGRLRESGIIVHSVAIGDPENAHPVPDGPRTPENRPVGTPPETRRSDVAFEAIARATGGALVPIGLGSADLGALFRERIGPVTRARRDEIRPPERVERFPAFLLTAVGVGLAGSWPGLARRRARRLAFLTLALAALGSNLGAGPDGPAAPELVARGRSAYEAGRFGEALGDFERAIVEAPEAAVPRFDAASALFQLRRFPEAIARYEEARERADSGLTIKVEYALGNAYLAIGDVTEAVTRYDACLASTLGGSAYDAVRLDAQLNRAFALERLSPPPDPTDPAPDSTGQSASNRPRPKREGRASAQPAPSPTNGPGGDRSTGGSDPEPGVRGAGGAGGSGQAPPEAGSPEARLDAMLKDVDDARRQRPSDPAPPASKGSAKDW